MLNSIRLERPPRRWITRGSATTTEVNALRRTLRLPEPLCRLLAVRGLGAEDDARAFLRPRLERLHDPYLLAGMDRAVERIEEAIAKGETILVHGDYDVDGIASTALYTRILRRLGAKVEPFVPHRIRDGYDLGSAGIEAAVKAAARLILTGDCGITATDAIRTAASLGIDVIVTDHHTPGPSLPPALAVINPRRSDCSYPEENLAGAGVAFKLCQALYQGRGLDEEELWYDLDLVALATIADLVPLLGENRILARYGLRVMEQSEKPGIRALIEVAGLSGPLTAGQVGHQLAPRINAVGRIDEASWGVRLLLTEDHSEAREIAEYLTEVNRERQAVDRRTLDEAFSILAADFDPDQDIGLVIAAPGWHPGVIGIVASRIVEELHRPTILISIDEENGRARGSGRSIRGFHLYDALDACSPYLERFGGHRQAAGLELERDQIEPFRVAFNERARTLLTEDDLTREVAIDLELLLHQVDRELYDYLQYFGPFGIRNPTPVFAARALQLVGRPRIVGRDHLKFIVGDGQTQLEAIAFRMADRVRELEGAREVDLAFQLHENNWNGRSSLQAKVVDLQVREGTGG